MESSLGGAQKSSSTTSMDNLCPSTINDCGAAVIWLCRNKKYLKQRCRWAKYGDKVRHDKAQRCSHIQYERTIQNDTIRYYEYKSTRKFLPAFKSDILVSRTANMTFSDIRTFSQHICPTGNPNDKEEKRGGHCDFQSTWRGPTHTRQLQVISVVLTRLVNLTNMSFVLTH